MDPKGDSMFNEMAAIPTGVTCRVPLCRQPVSGVADAVNKFCAEHRMEYMQREWDQCPRCSDTRIEALEGPDIDGVYAIQSVYCTACQASWIETYIASSRDNYEGGELG